MMFEYQTIGDFCKIITSGGTPNREKKEYYNGTIDWYKTQELRDSKLYSSDEKITVHGLNNSSAKLLPVNTVSMAMYGATVGKLGILKNGGTTNQAFCNMIVKNENDHRYLYYWLMKERETLIGLASGAAQQNLNLRIISGYRIPVIDIFKQNAIADILSSLDDKIELNNKINKNLEEVAQALYKRWFVDFEFPNENGEPYKSSGGEMVDSELGQMPKGWKNEALSSVLDNKRERVGSKDLPVLSAIKEGKLVLSSDFFTKDVPSKNLSKYLVVGQREFSYNPARINIGSIGMNEFDFSGCVSPIYVVLKSENLYVNFFSLYFKMKSFAEEVNLRASGSVRQSLNYDDLGRIMIVYPPRKIITEFNKIYDAIYAILKNNEKLNKKLSNTRDELLPKLMSGEIEVPVEE